MLNMLSFFHLIFFASLLKIRFSKVCGLISGSSIRFHWSSCLFFMPISVCFQYCSSVVEFEVRDCMPPEILLLYRIVLAILSFLLFHMKLSTVLSRSVKNFAGILMGIALNL